MKEIVEKNEFTAIVPLLEEGDPVKGGEGGTSNLQAQALANRTQFLKQQAAQQEQTINNLKPNSIGAAEATHQHLASDITDFDPRVLTLVSQLLVPGQGVTMGYDPVKKQLEIASKTLSDMPAPNDFLLFDRPGAIAGQNFSFITEAINTFKYQAYALKKEVGQTGQVAVLETFNVAAAGRYTSSEGVNFTASGISLENVKNTALSFDNTRLYLSALPMSDNKVQVDFEVGSLVPILTSNTSNADFEAIASSYWSNGGAYPPFAVFSDRSVTDYPDVGGGWASAVAPTRAAPQWIGVKTTKKVAINTYSFQNRASPTGANQMSAPGAFQLQGSNDGGVTWTNIDGEQTNTNTAFGAVTTVNVTDQTPYSAFRVLIYTAIGDRSSNFVYLRRLQFYSRKFGLLTNADKSKFFKVNNGTVTEVDGATDSAFAAAAFSSSGLISVADLSSRGITQIASLVAQTVTTSLLYQNRLVMPKALTAVNQWEVINRMTVMATLVGNGDVRAMVTRDLVNYAYLDANGAWVYAPLTADQAGADFMRANGMTVTAIAAITKAQWAALYADVGGVPDYIGLALGLVKPGLADSVTLPRVTLNVDNASTWKLQTPTEVEMRWSRTGITFKTVNAGDYILAYQIP